MTPLGKKAKGFGVEMGMRYFLDQYCAAGSRGGFCFDVGSREADASKILLPFFFFFFFFFLLHPPKRGLPLHVYQLHFFVRYFFYSSEACFKGEIVLPGYGRQIIPQTGGFCAINESNFTYPILLFFLFGYTVTRVLCILNSLFLSFCMLSIYCIC